MAKSGWGAILIFNSQYRPALAIGIRAYDLAQQGGWTGNENRKWSGPRQPLAMSGAPLAVPLDTEAPVARGFRRLHARGV